MDAKIQRALEAEGLKVTDLTEEELRELREEIIAKENDQYILDGVLWWVSRRKRKEETLNFVREFEAKANGSWPMAKSPRKR